MGAAIVSLVLLAAAPPQAGAVPLAPAPLTVTLDHALTGVTDSAAITVSGDALADLGQGSTIEVQVSGPALAAQIFQPSPGLPDAGSLTIAADSLPDVARPSASELRLPIPAATLPSSPGAFRITVEVRSGDTVVARGQTWMGRVASTSSPLDLAFVWRAELGIHRDADGRFMDTAIAEACAADGPLTGLAGLGGRFPAWRFSVGVEPMLLAQLRDMADGYALADSSGKGAAVAASDPTAVDAKAVLTALAGLAATKTVEIATAPYAGPDLGLLGAQDWRDGFEQVQLGKQEVVQTLALGLTPAGAYAPGLDLPGKSLSDLGRASVDHVLVDAGVAAGLSEPPAEGTVVVRAHDDANDRVTLILADADLRAVMAPPWDPAALFAGIAAVLASGQRDALVLTPGPEAGLPPQAYLDAIGRELEGDAWIRTQTMSDLIASHPPGTRPVQFNEDPAPQAGYIGQTLFSAIQSAHAVVDDLAAVAEPASLPLEAARRSLFIAESRWWSRAGVSPEQASAGLGYAVKAEKTARDELAKVQLKTIRHSVAFGNTGSVAVVLQNGAASAMTVQLRLSGSGLSFPRGVTVDVKLNPGNDTVKLPVVGTEGTHTLSVTVVAGRTVIDQRGASLRFVTLLDVAPWAGLAFGAIVVAAVAVALVRKSRRRRYR